MSMAVAMGATTVVMLFLLYFHRDQVELAVAHAQLGDNGVGELFLLFGRTTDHHHLQAVLMVQVDMQGEDRDIVMVVGQAPGQFPLFVIEHITEGADGSSESE